MQRGDIRWVNLDPVIGSEANKRRPAILVSNDGANRAAEQLGRGVVTVVPLTSSLGKVHPFQVVLPRTLSGLPHDSKAQAEQVRSVAVQRVGSLVGRVPSSTMRAVDSALRLHLDL